MIARLCAPGWATPFSTASAAVLASSDGTAIGKAQNVKGFLKVDQVEKLVESEMKQREESIKQQMKEAKEKAKAGDKEGAIPLFKSVMEQKCLFPGKAKDASKEFRASSRRWCSGTSWKSGIPSSSDWAWRRCSSGATQCVGCARMNRSISDAARSAARTTSSSGADLAMERLGQSSPE